jgi:hypothetical protein
MVDELSTYYADLLDGSYDCVDHIVLNAYNTLCYSPGGFRAWWTIFCRCGCRKRLKRYQSVAANGPLSFAHPIPAAPFATASVKSSAANNGEGCPRREDWVQIGNG